MPSLSNISLLAKRLQNCDQQFYQLFDQKELSRNFIQKLEQIKIYYLCSFNKVNDKDEAIKVIKEYEAFIKLASQVKSGEINADKAFESIKQTKQSQQAEIIFANFFKVCEMMFWATAAFFSSMACLSIGLPLTSCEPILGITVTLSTYFMACYTTAKFVECFDEFQSFDPIKVLNKNKKEVVTFFSKSEHQVPQEKDTALEEENISKNLYPVFQ
ncbi:DUF5638 domain-containing protein [Legionella norrlandica]|uniref:DUF5638 domain-containing protein n=1 Tax=Legionella norrlandica TaxID=1498499 RepID=UPI0005678E97|nr:DUF5638 domain-containing protein [Legionella norrlandica]